MAKILCKCGELLRLSSDNQYEFFLLSYDLIDRLEEQIDNGTLTGDSMNSTIVEEGKQVVRCDKCRRMYVDEVDDGKEALLVYKIERILYEGDERIPDD